MTKEVGTAEQGGSPLVTAFFCRGCTGEDQRLRIRAVLESVGTMQSVSLLCAGQVQTGFLLAALEAGADGVVLFACRDCRYRDGAAASTVRADKSARLLEATGIHPARIARFETSPRDLATPGPELEAWAETIRSLGCLPRPDKKGPGAGP